MYIQGGLFVYIYSYRQLNMPTSKHIAKYIAGTFIARCAAIDVVRSTARLAVTF